MQRHHPLRSKAGFTIIELMVVTVVVGVLAGIAVPIYGSYVRRTRVTEAQSRMGEMITAAKAFSQEHAALNGTPTWPPVAGEFGLMDMADSENFTYQISSGGGQPADSNPLVITATGKGKLSGITLVMTVPDMYASADAPVITGI